MNEHKNVTYLIRSPLSSRDYARFSIDEWKNRGWNVRVFDFWLNRRFWSYVGGDQLTKRFSGLTVLKLQKRQLTKLKKLKVIVFSWIFLGKIF